MTTTLHSIYSSPTASASLRSAFMLKSQQSMMATLMPTFGAETDSFTFSNSMPTFDATFYTALVQSGNTAVFGKVYKDADAFNTNLAGSVAASAGLHWDTSTLSGQLINTTM